MLRVPAGALRAIEQGARISYAVKIYWQQPETYTEDDYLIDVGDINTSMSGGGYAIADMSVHLKNKGYYFSRRLEKELPNNKLIETFMMIEGAAVLIARGIVPRENGWSLTDTVLTLNINA